jgi:hypothetical protein
LLGAGTWDDRDVSLAMVRARSSLTVHRRLALFLYDFAHGNLDPRSADAQFTLPRAIGHSVRLPRDGERATGSSSMAHMHCNATAYLHATVGNRFRQV